MRAVDRFFETQDWLTLSIIFLILLLFILRAINIEKLSGYFVAPFYKGFVDIEFEERVSIFNPFYVILYIFSVSSICIFSFLVIKKSNVDTYFTEDFLWFSFFFFSYFLVKKILEILIVKTLNLQEIASYYLFTKTTYLYSIGFYFLIGSIFFTYTNSSFNLHIIYFIICLILRYFTILIVNKNMIISYIFYFILYLCTFEIAPLLILYNLML